MQVLLLDDDRVRHEEIMITFLKAGAQIAATSSLRVAEAIIDQGYTDLLVANETLQSRLTHSAALLAEHRNPSVATILISDRADEDVDELYELLPSVHCIVGRDVSAKLIYDLGRASVLSQAPRMRFRTQDGLDGGELPARRLYGRAA